MCNWVTEEVGDFVEGVDGLREERLCSEFERFGFECLG